MAHVCGYCSTCLEILFRQGGLPGPASTATAQPPPIEARGQIARNDTCCHCGLRAPFLYGSAAEDRVVKNHGQHPGYPGQRRS